MKIALKQLLISMLLSVCSAASAMEQLITLPIDGRSNDFAPVLQNRKSGEAVNVILIPGAGAGTGEIRNGLPVLMIHHEADACSACVPSEASELFKGFTRATSKQFSMVSGGGPASGDPCQNQHWHGFVGIESTVTRQIVQWIKDNG